MKTITAGTFSKKCIALVEEVHAKRKAILITNHGKPIAKLVPVVSDGDEICGFLVGKGTVSGDIISPAI